MNFDINRLTGFVGIFLILFIAFLYSNNKKNINYKLVLNSLFLQFLTGVFILKTILGKKIFLFIASVISSLLDISKEGGKFVFGFLMDSNTINLKITPNGSFIFAVQVVPTIILICSLVSILYYFGILQFIVKIFAVFFNKFLGVSGAEALANSTVAFVGQVESAIIIQPFLSKLTKSELLTIMTGGMACISGSLMAIYSSLGVNAEYLLTASCMAIPGSFLISKIVYPENEVPETKDVVNVAYQSSEKNLIEAILDGAFSGLKISAGVIAMLIAFISLVALVDKILFLINDSLSLKFILGYIFMPLVYFFGAPTSDVKFISELLGTKISLNEFIAYLDLSNLIKSNLLTPKGIAIASFTLCGFANFGSIAIQVGGLAQMAPDRKSDLSALGLKSMICGALVSCLSACIVGIIF